MKSPLPRDNLGLLRLVWLGGTGEGDVLYTRSMSIWVLTEKRQLTEWSPRVGISSSLARVSGSFRGSPAR